jgi:hypothetical protein
MNIATRGKMQNPGVPGKASAVRFILPQALESICSLCEVSLAGWEGRLQQLPILSGGGTV